MPGVLLFGDSFGLSRLLRVLGPDRVYGLVRAEVRPSDAEAVEALARDRSLPLLVQPRPGAGGYGEFAEEVRAASPELIAVDSYSMLLPGELLAIPPRGAVNLHYALLPRYRGPHPTQWALINGEQEAGATLHRMSEDFDQGEIIDQRRVPVAFTDTWRDVNIRIDPIAEEMLAEQLPLVLDGTAGSSPQDESVASRFPRRDREDGRINWDWSLLRIHDLVRALVSPLPSAFYEVDGREVVLDSYMTISELAALKFGDAGRRELGDGNVVLHPLTATASDEMLEFAVHRGGDEPRGCGLRVDWEARTARTWERDPGEQSGAVGALLRRFASEEMGVDVIDAGSEQP